jgi:epoxyqueuosine reductase
MAGSATFHGTTGADSAADTAWIAERARAVGFDLCGVARAEKFPELSRMEEWLARGYAGEMKYLSDPRRANPETAMPGVRSVIVCALNYNAAAPRSTDALQRDEAKDRGWISRYAWGDDYHEVLQEKLRNLADALPERFAKPFEARIYSDTGPVNERVLAKHAGLGWLGKNTLLLNQKLGSWFFLGVILTTLELTPTAGAAEMPPKDFCGSCTKCIEACPTQALVEPYVMDSRLCIAYLTIEFRGSIPEQMREPMGRHVFGCDICQDVCPWNRRAPTRDLEAFRPRTFPSQPERSVPAQEPESLLLPRLEWLASLSEEQFRSYFRASPVKRTKWRGLVRNACIALGNSVVLRGSAQHEKACAVLKQLAISPEASIAESAQWALSRIE